MKVYAHTLKRIFIETIQTCIKSRLKETYSLFAVSVENFMLSCLNF